MAFPVTLNGRTYTLTDFEGTNYVDGLPDAFEDFVTHAGDIYNSTSTTSNSIGTGSKTFTVEANKPYQAGTPLRIADAAAPSTNFLDTVVTSYSGTTLVVNSIGYGGSGTKTSWTVNIGGAKTVDGTLGLSQGGTGATDAAGARTNIDVYSKADADSRFLNVSGEASDVTMTGDVTIGNASSDTLTVVAGASFSADVAFDTNTLFVDATNNRIGIGTASPDASLEISNSSSVPSISYGRTPYSSHGNFTIGGTSTGSLASNTDEDGNSTVNVNASRILLGNGEIIFQRSPNTAVGSARTFTERMRIEPDGDIAFGDEDSNTYGWMRPYEDTTGNLIISSDQGGQGSESSIKLRTRGANKMVVKHNGDVEVVDGNLVIGTSGHGIDFSATANGSGTTNSELLDDYEYGFFEPTFTGTTTNPSGITYDPTVGNEGYYVKVGRAVFIQINIRTDAISDVGVGDLRISGLPFATPSVSGQGGVGSFAIGQVADFAGEAPDSAYVSEGSTNITLFYRSSFNGTSAASQCSDLGTGLNDNLIRLSGTYYSTE